MIILDCGSGNSCKNRIDYACGMVKAIAEIGLPAPVIVKWQLFKRAGDNAPLSLEVFERAYKYAEIMGLRTTASVFDEESLDYLLTFNVPFVKIANQPASKAMLASAEKKMAGRGYVLVSTDDPKSDAKNKLYCISEYPAKAKDYIDRFGDKLKAGISDHTADFELFKKYSPKVYECHFKLNDTTGPDAGPFARTPESFKEILS
ncbi:MAG TPA: N-acetylneuraminate synthase family protein [Dissulfurispiraceae bacterium]|nr:N-acetylneuraminate synthase family protein [Dissulfurispiraceae bacterium]